MREIVKRAVFATEAAEQRLEHSLPDACNEAVAEWLATDVAVMQQIKQAIKDDVPAATLFEMVDGVRAIKAKAILSLEDTPPS